MMNPALDPTIQPLPRRPERPDAWRAPASVRTALRVMSYVHPRLAADFVTRRFINPPRSRRSPQEEILRAEATRLQLPKRPRSVVLHRWSRGPFLPWENRGTAGKVLLVHGWGGRATQLGAFVEPLRSLGFEVWGLDAPGHGDSAAGECDPEILTQALHEVDEAYGPFAGAVGHSMGGGALGVAISEGLRSQRAVLIGSPSQYGDVQTRVLSSLELAPAAARLFQARLAARFGPRLSDRFDVAGKGHRLAGTPALVLHDVDDGAVPFDDARRYERHWPGARLVATAGLGHHRILRDPVVIEQVKAFLSETLTVTRPFTAAPPWAPLAL